MPDPLLPSHPALPQVLPVPPPCTPTGALPWHCCSSWRHSTPEPLFTYLCFARALVTCKNISCIHTPALHKRACALHAELAPLHGCSHPAHVSCFMHKLTACTGTRTFHIHTLHTHSHFAHSHLACLHPAHTCTCTRAPCMRLHLACLACFTPPVLHMPYLCVPLLPDILLEAAYISIYICICM